MIKNENQDNLNSIMEELDDQIDKNSFTIQQQTSNQLVTSKLSTKENLSSINGFTLSASKSKEKDKKDKKKKRTKSTNQDDLNLQILNASSETENRVLFKMNSQTKSNQQSNNDFLLESMKLINESNDRKLPSNQINSGDEEKMPLV